MKSTRGAAAGALSSSRYTAWRRLARGGAPDEEPSDGDRRDRAQADRLVRGVLRTRSLLDACLTRDGLFHPARTPEALMWVLRLAAYEKIFQTQSPDYAIGQQSTSLARRVGGERAARFVNALMRRLLARLPETPEALRDEPWFDALTPAQRWSTPQPVLDALEGGYSAAAARKVVQALAEREAPIWLRVNRLRATPEQLRRALAEEGVDTTPEPSLPEALCWTGGGETLPWQTQAWARGAFTVQDAAAMLAAPLLGVEPDMRVLDACAAPGGKTGHLWETMAGRGSLTALEVDPARRVVLRETMTRLYGEFPGLGMPECDTLKAFRPSVPLDRVLLDAPCQALGLIRRHPEIRWDGRLRRREAMQRTQRALLEACARWVAPGGRLLWVTCSPTRAENEEIVRPWLATHPDWRLVDPMPGLPPGAEDWTQCDDGFLRTRPDRLDCDAFAFALLERAPGRG